MRLSKSLKIVFFTGIFTISNFFYSHPEKVQAQSSSNAFVVFVNGSGDCCAGYMTEVINRVKEGGNEVWTTSYASFRNGSTTNKVSVVNVSTDLDANFIGESTLILNNIPESRPIILIGHSYGGDSILKILPLVERRIQLVVTIDPVGTGGFRQIAISRRVPPNVDYFMNRWQENGLSDSNIVPFDSRSSGSISCNAKVCDQESQNLARNTDGSEKRVSCDAHEVTCDGWRLPGCNFSGCWKGSNGTKAKRMFHNDMPVNDFIQRIVGNKIRQQLVAFSESVPIERLAEGFGHAKNARLKFEGKLEEPMAGHINWCMSQSTQVCRAQILDELRMLEIGFKSNGLNCEGFGHLKNAYLTLSEGRIEPLAGHSNWCRSVSADIAIDGLMSYERFIKEKLGAQ
jgi:hypothetical protein